MTNKCPHCNKPFSTIDTKVRGSSRIRYIGCRACKTRPDSNKVVIPLQYAPVRLVGFALAKRD